MRLLINGRESRGPGAYIIGLMMLALVIVVLLFFVLPILVGVAIVLAAAAALYVGARAVGLIGRGRNSTRDAEAHYRIESSRQHEPRDPSND